jgi:predicted nucleic acid-binding protein
MFTVDASVHVNAACLTEPGAAESQTLIDQLHERPWLVFSPTLLLVEIAAAVARNKNDAMQGMAMAQAVRALPGQVWVPLDDALADQAVQMATDLRLRGGDAVYAAVAHRYGTTLITRDRQQLERLSSAITVLTPAQALGRLAKLSKAEKRRR